MNFIHKVAPKGANRHRNIAIVCHHYGLQGAAWPTLRATADEFGLRGRELIRQTLDKTFYSHAPNKSDLPGFWACADLLRSRHTWVGSKFSRAISAYCPDSDRFNVKALLNIMVRLAIDDSYDLHNHLLNRVTRSEIEDISDVLILKTDVAAALKPVLNKARSWPSYLGLASTQLIPYQVGASEFEVLVAALKLDKNVWTEPDQQAPHFWYCVEDRQNTLINSASKSFAAAKSIDLDRLSVCLSNAPKCRTPRTGKYPATARIKSYIEESKYFIVHDGMVRFKGHASNLSDIQNTMLEFFKVKPIGTPVELDRFLERHGFEEASRKKSIYYSPLIHIDRSNGRLNPILTLVGRGTESFGATGPG